MTYRRETEVVEPAPVVQGTTVHREVEYRRHPLATLERLIVFIFGLIQLLILLRIVLLLFAARQGNDLVAFIYGVSEIFVAPFRGILGRNEIQAGATELDISAIVALIGWTILELIVLALIRIFRPSRSV